MWSDAFGGQLLAPLAGLSGPPLAPPPKPPPHPNPHLELLLIKGMALSRLLHPPPPNVFEGMNQTATMEKSKGH